MPIIDVILTFLFILGALTALKYIDTFTSLHSDINDTARHESESK